jgi:hypothetical protein
MAEIVGSHRVLSPKSFSPLLMSIAPNPSVLVQYPIFFTMARVTVHRELSQRGSRQVSSVVASFQHGVTLYQKYGLFALYRGLPVYMGHSFATTLLSHPIKSMKLKKISAVSKVAVDAITYPLLVACTRMAAYTTEDSSWSFTDCVNDTLRFDGWRGLWAGALPFLIVSAYKEVEEIVYNLFVKSSTLDETDTALIGFIRLGLGAVITSPFLTMSTILRCQSNHPSLLKPTSFAQVFRDMPWKWNLIALSAVVGLGAVNLALIHEKHRDDSDKEVAEEK